MAWTLSKPGVTGAICGARSPEQVEGWIEAAELDLAPEVVAELDALAGGQPVILAKEE